MQSSDRNVCSSSQSRADSAFHMPRTVSSTDTCRLTFLHRDRRRLVRGPQEPAGPLLTDEGGGLAVEEHRTPADQHGVEADGVAVDHAGQTAILIDTILGVVVVVVWRDPYDMAVTDGD